jgi:hypothetical protein
MTGESPVALLVLRYLFYRYLRVPPGNTQKSTAQKCNVLLSIKIHVLEIQRVLLSMDTSVKKIFGDRCIRPICIDMMVVRPIV